MCCPGVMSTPAALRALLMKPPPLRGDDITRISDMVKGDEVSASGCGERGGKLAARHAFGPTGEYRQVGVVDGPPEQYAAMCVIETCADCTVQTLAYTACALASAFSHQAVVSMLVSSHGVVPWRAGPCAVCLVCSPPVIIPACDVKLNHREREDACHVAFSAVHAASAVGNLEMLQWLVTTFPRCREACTGGSDAEVCSVCSGNG